MKKKVFALLIILVVIFSGCENSTSNTEVQNNKPPVVSNDVRLNIVTTDRILYYMVKSIVQDRHNVEYIFKDRETQYNYNFTEDSLYNIGKKDLFIYMGASYEPWADAFTDKLDKDKTRVINVSRGVKISNLDKEIKYKDTVLKENPYYLMNYDNFKIALLNIKNSIQDKDPKNRDFYEKNFNEEVKATETEQKAILDITSKLSDYTFVYAEDKLEYFVKYNSLNSIRLTEANTVLKNPSKTVFLYCDSNVLTANEGFIKNNNLNTLNVRCYQNDIKYEDILLLNKGLFTSYYNSIIIKK
ncbi:MAG: metal ABC transporter substrate-binding protein [Solirubrobacterales bacterium]